MKQSRLYGFRVGEEVKTTAYADQCLGHLEGEVVGIKEGDACDTLYVLDHEKSTHQRDETGFFPPDDWQERTKTE